MKLKFFIIFVVLSFADKIISLDLNFDTNNDGKPDRWISIVLYKEWKKFDFNKNEKADEECFYIDETEKIFLINEEKFEYQANNKPYKGLPNVWLKYKIQGNDFYSEMTADSDSNGNIELIVTKKNNIINLKKTDNNNDGKFDFEEHHDENGYKIKEITDVNKDGKYDDYYFYENNRLNREELDTNFDGKIDQWVIFEYKEDGSIKECIIKKDNNHDGKADEWHYTDDRRRVVKTEFDKDYDGIVDDVKNF